MSLELLPRFVFFFGLPAFSPTVTNTNAGCALFVVAGVALSKWGLRWASGGCVGQVGVALGKRGLRWARGGCVGQGCVGQGCVSQRRAPPDPLRRSRVLVVYICCLAIEPLQ